MDAAAAAGLPAASATPDSHPEDGSPFLSCLSFFTRFSLTPLTPRSIMKSRIRAGDCSHCTPSESSILSSMASVTDGPTLNGEEDETVLANAFALSRAARAATSASLIAR